MYHIKILVDCNRCIIKTDLNLEIREDSAIPLIQTPNHQSTKSGVNNIPKVKVEQLALGEPTLPTN